MGLTVHECGGAVQHTEHFGVIEVHPILRRRQGHPLPVTSYILTFDTPTLPSSIRVGYLQLAIKRFVPKPIRCRKCFSFSHLSRDCTSKDLCYRCGDEKHESNCNTVKCVNCGNDHFSTSLKCPCYKNALLIKELQTKYRIPYGEAKRMAENNQSKTNYANILKTSLNSKVTCSVSCQISAPLKKDACVQTEAQTDTRIQLDKNEQTTRKILHSAGTNMNPTSPKNSISQKNITQENSEPLCLASEQQQNEPNRISTDLPVQSTGKKQTPATKKRKRGLINPPKKIGENRKTKQ